jgi:hypothetical protein
MLQYILRRRWLYGAADPAGCEPGDLHPVLHRQHARRHGAPEPGRQAGHAEAIEKWKAERGYDKPLYFNDKAQQGTEQLTETIFWERSVSLFALEFGRADSEAPATSATRWPAHGVSLQMALPLFVLQVIASTAFALLLVMFRNTRLDFWGVVSLRGDAVDLQPVLHHRRPVPVLAGAQAGAHLGLCRGWTPSSSWCCPSA